MPKTTSEAHLNRREMLIGLGLTPLAASSLAGICLAQQADHPSEKAAERMVELLFVQTAHRAAIKDGKLTLEDVAPATLYFSDRPQRVTGHLATEHFIDSWGKGKDCFAGDPPNAVLSLLHKKDAADTVVVLRNPTLHQRVLTFEVQVLEGDATASGGPCSLFIDTIGKPFGPQTFDSHGRQVWRRTQLKPWGR